VLDKKNQRFIPGEKEQAIGWLSLIVYDLQSYQTLLGSSDSGFLKILL